MTADTTRESVREFLARSGEVGGDLLAVDWAATPLGSIEAWPGSLTTVVRVLLTSRFAMWMACGPELTFLCNDAYRRDTLGKKYPWALGQPAREVWAEIWLEIGPRIQAVMSTGQATWDEALMLILERSGYREETYHTFSYSPLHDDQGLVAGMLCVVSEETTRVIGERRMATLRELGSVASGGREEREFLDAACEVLGSNRFSLPFTVVDLSDARFSELPTGAWDEPPERALLLPIPQPAHSTPFGFFVAGLNRFCPLDSDYSSFVGLIAQHLAAGIAAARAYDAERRRAKQLEELDRAKTAFFSNVSHEFRTPLTLMIGPLQDALGDPDGLASGQLELVHRNALRLLKLVNSLLDFSRAEAGRMRAEFRPTDIAKLTAELASTFREATERAGLELVGACDPPSQPVYVDRDLWERIVLNLISNAFKATLHGRIEVRIATIDRHVELAVIDPGTGIPPEEIARLFQRFHRVRSVARSYEGTGIGLALVRELAELHGGEVSVDSTVGKGSRFTVRVPLGSAHLPADQVHEESHEPAATIAPLFVEEAMSWIEAPSEALVPGATELSGGSGDGGSRPRVLIADDNPDLRRYLTMLLASQFDVEAVSDGTAALAVTRERRPDLLISDVMMPGMDGYELLAALRSSPDTQDLPVILLSARAGEESAIEGLEAGADDYLPKPFSGRELLARVSAHLFLSSLRRQAAADVRAERSRLEQTLQQMPAGVLLAEAPSGRIMMGNEQAAEILGEPIRDEDGEVAAGVLVFQDVSDRVRSERLLAAQRASWRSSPTASRFSGRWTRSSCASRTSRSTTPGPRSCCRPTVAGWSTVGPRACRRPTTRRWMGWRSGRRWARAALRHTGERR